ncbi:hypothetical protein MTO96_006279 [Rhipicephalus appendiculatus]
MFLIAGPDAGCRPSPPVVLKLCGVEKRYPLATNGEVLDRAPKTKGEPNRRRLHSFPPWPSPRPSIDSPEFRISRPAKRPREMMAAGPRGTERTMDADACAAVANAAVAPGSGGVDRRPGRFSAQIAHHTELPYIRDPPEPSNVVDGPLPDEFEVPETSSIDGGDPALSTESDTNDESNEIHAADGLGVHGEVLSLRPQNDAGVAPESLVVPNSQRPSPVAPYDSRNPPKLYAPLHERYRLPERPFSYVRTFQCNFEEHACGMRNQKNIGDHFKLVSNSIAGRRGRYMAVDSQTVPAGVSRLITPYLPGYPNSMFFIEAYTNGQPGLIAIDDFTYSFDPCRR